MNAKIKSWDELRLFLALVREGTLAAAGAALSLDQSTVFRRLRALERSLAVKLVERRGRGYCLTAAGEELSVHAERLEEEVHAVERALAGRDAELSGNIRVTTSDTVAQHLLPDYLVGFRERYPSVTIDLVVEDRFAVLSRGEADIALRAGPKPAEPDVIAIDAGLAAGAFYAGRIYLDRAGRPRRRTDIADHDLVALDQILAHVPFAQLTCEIAPATVPVVRCTSLMAQAAAVEAGLGIAALPCFLMDAREQTVRLFPPEPKLESGLWLILHRDLRRTARVRAFVDFVTERMRADRSKLLGSSKTE